METIRAVIIDDEKNVREGLYGIINKYCPNVEVLGLASNAHQGIELIAETKPDLVFVDVQMRGMTGFDMLKEIGEVDFDVIFVTSFDKYALKAIKYSALDYLLKPINIAELQIAISKFDRGRKEQVSSLLENLNNPGGKHKIAIKHSRGIRYANEDEIIRCQADGNYSTIFFQDSTNLLVAKTLKEFDELLPIDTFFRVHQSHIINLHFVKAYHQGRGGDLEMENGDMINVARSRKKDLLNRLGSVEER